MSQISALLSKIIFNPRFPPLNPGKNAHLLPQNRFFQNVPPVFKTLNFPVAPILLSKTLA